VKDKSSVHLIDYRILQDRDNSSPARSLRNMQVTGFLGRYLFFEI